MAIKVPVLSKNRKQRGGWGSEDLPGYRDESKQDAWATVGKKHVENTPATSKAATGKIMLEETQYFSKECT